MKIRPLSQKWGRFPIYQAKIGTGCSTCVIVRRVRKFYVGQRIKFCDLWDLEGKSVGMAPQWRDGKVWRIDDDRLFIDRF